MKTPDVYVVHKKSAWDRYGQNNQNGDQQVNTDDKQVWQKSHTAHHQCLDAVFQALNELRLHFESLDLDQLRMSPIKYFSGSNGGMMPNSSLVLSVGGDGTLLHASHYIGGRVKLLGFNSSPDTSVGHLCPGRAALARQFIRKALELNRATVVRRIKTELNATDQLPLALNDLLFCNAHPAATSRYAVEWNLNSHLSTERQQSSGIWISTAAGSSGAMTSYAPHNLPLNSEVFRLAVREPYPRSLRPNAIDLNANTDNLTLHSSMRQALVCVDGADFTATLARCDWVKISLPQSCTLELIDQSHFNDSSFLSL